MNFFRKFNHVLLFFIFVILFNNIHLTFQLKTFQKNIFTDIVDIKDFKKLLRTKNNVLALFVNSLKQTASVIKVFEETAGIIKGQGTMVLTDCSGEAKKLCKKLKINPSPYVIKHYKDGLFHKDYDRKHTVASMLNFMRDPSGDIPWDEDPSAAGIVHITDYSHLIKFLRKESGPVMIMFYAPWCGFCKQLKPEYVAAANKLKGHSVLAAIDVNKPENTIIRSKYNITGFPTLIYFENGVKMFNYEGENNKESLIAFMKDPTAPNLIKPVENEWSESASEIEHLTDDTFHEVIKKNDGVLVMFYAPWCGHCKRLKPIYEKVANKLKNSNINGVLAALDATKETKTAKKFNINGYPTLKYFKKGDFLFDVNFREEKELLNFMKDPKQPPPPPPPPKPWAEEESEVEHLTAESFKPFLKKKKFALVMFYAPWCGHCKKAKPEFTASAEIFKDDSKVAFAAVDCTSYQSICATYNVKGYPTIKLFHYLNKEAERVYTGERTEADFTKFMKEVSNQQQFESPKTEILREKNTEEKLDLQETSNNFNHENNSSYDDWSAYENSDLILQLTDENFNQTIKNHDFLLVFFYKNDCSKCKEIKKEYSLAALMVENRKMKGKLAAYNASKNRKIEKINVYPSIRLYRKGNFLKSYSGKFIANDFFHFLSNISKGIKDEL